jgi:hypothetical protein
MKRISILFLIATIMLTVVFVGSFATIDKTKYDNDFVRIFPSHFMRFVSSLKIENGSLSVSGFANNKIYVHNRSNHGSLMAIDAQLAQAQPVPVEVQQSFAIAIDSPDFFLYNGYIPVVRRGNLSDWCVDATLNHLPSFTLIQPISSSVAILRTIDLKKRKSVFVRSDFPGSPKDILSKQVDGILCTDGFLLYSKEYHRLVYTYRYRNQFLCLDTMLVLQMTGRTIDTTSIAKISVKEIEGEIKMSKPPLIVNKGTCLSGKYLFVHSNLIARNESVDRSKNSSVIDVYDILNGRYMFSFYVENFDGKKMLSFKVYKHMLIATFPERVARYDLNQKYFPL